MKILKWFGIILGSLLLLFFLFIFQPWVFLPHKHIEIGLPFAESSDATVGLIPMGEKIEHNASNGTPDGHPGIDFGFGRVTGIISVADCTVNQISKNPEGSINIETNCGFYKVAYKELNSIEPNIKMFSKVKKGQLLGYTGFEGIRTKEEKEKGPSGQIHWEFSSASMFIDRLCPVNYFDANAKARIEKIWARIPETDQFKKLYPDICSGIFKNKED